MSYICDVGLSNTFKEAEPGTVYIYVITCARFTMRMRISDSGSQHVLEAFLGSCAMSAANVQVVLRRGMERVEVDSSRVTTETLRRTFRVRHCVKQLKRGARVLVSAFLRMRGGASSFFYDTPYTYDVGCSLRSVAESRSR